VIILASFVLILIVVSILLVYAYKYYSNKEIQRLAWLKM